jgi:SAM-dependent methyltransferase
MIFEYRGDLYPEYLRTGNACQHIAATALHYCKGQGLDIGAGKWPLPGATPVDFKDGGDAMRLPEGWFDFCFSSHCLEHLDDPIAALEHWNTRIKPGGVLFLYLPHPGMTYWRPQHCRKHRHSWRPEDMAQIVRDLGFINVLHSERDLAWSFSVVGFKA